MSDRAEKGRRVQAQMLGQAFVEGAVAKQESGAFGSYISRHAHESCFGDIWNRPGLDLRSRSIATIAFLMALKTPRELKNHIKAGLANGLTVAEIEELLIHGVPYLGYPTTAVALSAAQEALVENGNLPPAS